MRRCLPENVDIGNVQAKKIAVCAVRNVVTLRNGESRAEVQAVMTGTHSRGFVRLRGALI
jgi:hypothetical protein